MTQGTTGTAHERPADALEAFLREACGVPDARVAAIDFPEDRERLSVEVRFEDETRDPLPLVVELAAGDERGSQAERLAVVEAARTAGVPAPEPLGACEDAAVLGRPFHVLRAAPGSSGAVSTGAFGSVGATLARLHGVRPPWPGLEALEDPGPSLGLARVTEMRARLDALDAPQPALEWVLRTLERRARRFDEVVLGHGALEPAACRFEGETLVAIERWRGARWAHPLEDVACLCLGLEREGAGRVDEPLQALVREYGVQAGRRLDTEELPYWLLLAATEHAVESLEGPAEHATPRAVLEAFSRAEAMRASGAAADLGRIGGARRAFESEILSRAGATTRSAGERHLSALYGDDAGPAGLSRFSRDVRDGVFDGACAQGARVLIVGWLEETLAAGEAASDTAS